MHIIEKSKERFTMVDTTGKRVIEARLIQSSLHDVAVELRNKRLVVVVRGNAYDEFYRWSVERIKGSSPTLLRDVLALSSSKYRCYYNEDKKEAVYVYKGKGGHNSSTDIVLLKGEPFEIVYL